MSLPEFIWKPHRIKQERIRFNTISTPFEGGRIQYRSKGPLPRIWRLTFSKHNMGKDEPKEIRDFFEARQGRLEPFNWVVPIDAYDDPEEPPEETEETVKVHFNTDTLDRRILDDTVYTFTLEFIESLW